MQHCDSSKDNDWFIDRSIDWIECPYPSDVEALFGENEASLHADNEKIYNYFHGDDDNNEDEVIKHEQKRG